MPQISSQSPDPQKLVPQKLQFVGSLATKTFLANISYQVYSFHYSHHLEFRRVGQVILEGG